MFVILGITIGILISLIGFKIKTKLLKKKNCTHNWEIVEGGNKNKAPLVYCNLCKEFSFKYYMCNHKYDGYTSIHCFCGRVYCNPVMQELLEHRHGYGGKCSLGMMSAFYQDKERTESLMYRDYPEYTKYIRSPLYDAHQLDKELESFDPLKEKFKLLEAKMNNKVLDKLEKPLENTLLLTSNIQQKEKQ